MRAALPLFPLLALALLVPAACNKTREPDATGEPPRPPKITVDRPSPKQLSVKPDEPRGPTDVAFDAPAAWPKAENASPMRKATYRIPRVAPDGEDGELSVTQAGGSVDQNVARWAGQFAVKAADVKREVKRAGELRVTVVEMHGAYTGMAMPGASGDGAKGPKPGFALLGAIVETSPPTFFKLTGPEKTVMAARPEFDKLVAGLRAK